MKLTEENIKYLIEHSGDKNISEWGKYFGCSRTAICTVKKKYNLLMGGKKPYRHSNETLQIMSKKRKEWYIKNPDKHPWRNNNKFKSTPCEKVKEFLKYLEIQFVEEFDPEIEDRFFSIDIALPDKRIALEINGNQHYDKNGELKPYYQNRQYLLEKYGWTVYQIHYSACFNLEQWSSFIKDICETEKKVNFDYFNYVPHIPKYKNPAYTVCSCGGTKLHTSKVCRKCSGKQKYTKTKIQWPDLQDLLQMIEKTPMSELGKQLGVSDNAIRRHCKLKGISSFPSASTRRKQYISKQWRT